MGNVVLKWLYSFKLAWILARKVAKENVYGCSFVLIWIIWKEKNEMLFEDVKLVDQTLKSLFLCALLDWVRKSIVEILLFMVVFVDWLDAL